MSNGAPFGPGGKPFGPGGETFGPHLADSVLNFPLVAVLDFPLSRASSFSAAVVDDDSEGQIVLDFPLSSGSSFSTVVVSDN